MRKNKAEDSHTANKSNQLLYLEFRKLIKIYEHIYKQTNDLKDKTIYKHKIISLKNSSKQIKVFPDAIKDPKQIEHLPGVGKGTLMRVEDFLNNKKLTEVEDYCNQNNCDIILFNKNPNLIYEDLITIFGIGDKLANKLINDYKLKSVKQLQTLVSRQLQI